MTLFAGCVKDNGSGTDITSIDDLSGRKIAVMAGTVQELIATERFTDATLISIPSESDVYLNVSKGKTDAAIVSCLSWEMIGRQFPQLKCICDTVNRMACSSIFRKGNDALKESFNAFLDDYLESDTWKESREGWSGSVITRKMPVIDPEKCPNGTLVAATAPILPPITFIKDNVVSGIEAELLVHFAESLGMNIRFETMEWPGVIASIASGKCDIGFDCICITDERQEQVDFARPYMWEASAIITSSNEEEKAAHSEQITSIDDLAGKKVALILGTTFEIWATENLKNSELFLMNLTPDPYTALIEKKVDAVVVSSLNYKFALADYPFYKIIGENIEPTDIAVVFKKGNDKLREKFNLFVRDFQKTDEYREMVEQWSDPNTDREMPRQTGFYPNGILKVATDPANPPFEYFRKGEVVGSEVEMIIRFAESVGMEVSFSLMDFAALIPSVTSGKCDAAFGIISVTEERKESVDFSVPWIQEGTTIIVRDESLNPESEDDFISGIKKSFIRNFITEDRWKLLVDGLWCTLIIVFFSAILGTLLGIFLCYFYMHRNRFLRGTAGVFIDFMRCMPQMVLLMIMYYIVFGDSDLSGTVVAIVSFSLCFAAYCSVIFRSSVICIDKGQNEAAMSMGFTRMQTFFNIILPQAVQNALPVYKSEFIGLIKATSIVGYVAVFDLTKASDFIRSRTYEPFFPLIIITIIYFLIIWVLSFALKYAEFKTKPKRKKF